MARIHYAFGTIILMFILLYTSINKNLNYIIKIIEVQKIKQKILQAALL